MTNTTFSDSTAPRRSDPSPDDRTLRLLWPQWQGGGGDLVASSVSEVPPEDAVRGYVVGTRVLEAVIPPHDGPTAIVPVEMSDRGREESDGVIAKKVVLEQLTAALNIIADHHPARIVTLGGDCAVSVAPFSALAARYGDQLAVVWIDSHPDVGTADSAYHGYHAMAVSVLTGHGDVDIVAQLPATVPADRVALTGLHRPADDDLPNIAAWGTPTFSPSELRENSNSLLAWLAETGCTKIAIHIDVDTVDTDEVLLGMTAERGGLTTTQVRRIIDDLAGEAEVVGLTVAEYIPRQVMQMRRFVTGMPLIQAKD